MAAINFLACRIATGSFCNRITNCLTSSTFFADFRFGSLVVFPFSIISLKSF